MNGSVAVKARSFWSVYGVLLSGRMRTAKTYFFSMKARDDGEHEDDRAE